MSMCIRPVVERWGESLTYSSRETEIDELLDAIAYMAETDKLGDFSEHTASAIKHYDDRRVVWIQDGAHFLDYLAKPDILTVIMDELAGEGRLSDDDDEYQRQRSDITNVIGMVAAWRKSIDPFDGSLRIYCD